MYTHLFQTLSFAIYFASVLSHLENEPVRTSDYSEESGDGASHHPEQASTLAYPWASTEILNISMNGQSLWNGSGSTPVRSEDTRDLEVNEAPLHPLVPEWSNRSVHVPRLPLHRAASPPRPHQFLSGREADTRPHQLQSAASQHRGRRGTETSQNPTNLGQQLVFGLDMQPRPARSRRLSSQQKEINARRRSHGWQTCERHKRSKKFCPCNVPAVELENLAQPSTSSAFGQSSSEHDENTSAELMHAEEFRPLKRRHIGQIDTISGENHESLVTTLLKMRDPNWHDPLASLVESATDTSSLPSYLRPLRVRDSAEEPDVAPGEDYYTHIGMAQDELQLDLYNKAECSANLQSIPETRAITQEQLINEVKGIYAGLTMVEEKCVEIDSHKSSTTGHLNKELRKTLTTLHRTLLHEHHDFYSASQHPSSSPALRRLVTQYAMPARISRNGIEEADPLDKDVWSGVSQMWYRRTAGERLDTGSIPPPPAVLARLDSELLESERDRRRGSTSNDDNIDHHGSTLRARVENIVTHPSAWDENTADYAQEHRTGYFDLQAHQLEHFPEAQDFGLVPEGLNDNDPGLESGNKSVRDQRFDLGEPRPLPEDFLLREQVWHNHLGGEFSLFYEQPGSSQEAAQSTVDNPEEIAFNEWIGVDRYDPDDMDLGLLLQTDTMPSNDDYLPGMDWTVQFSAVVHGPLPIDTAENLLNIIREGVLSEERRESDITRNEKRHESQNVKACSHNNLIRAEMGVDRTEKAANTVTADLVIADFARHIPKTAEPRSVIPEPEIDLQSKPFHLLNNTTNHCASLDMAERSNKNCNYSKVGTATKLPFIAERLESSIKATANDAQYPLKAVLMIFTLILTSLTPLGRPIDGVSALPLAIHLYGRLLAEKSRHMLLPLLGLILEPISGIYSTRRKWRQVMDLWTVCFYMVVQSFQGCERLR